MRAEAFVFRRSGCGDENQETQLCRIGLFQNALGFNDALECLKIVEHLFELYAEKVGESA